MKLDRDEPLPPPIVTSGNQWMQVVPPRPPRLYPSTAGVAPLPTPFTVLPYSGPPIANPAQIPPVPVKPVLATSTQPGGNPPVVVNTKPILVVGHIYQLLLAYDVDV